MNVSMAVAGSDSWWLWGDKGGDGDEEEEEEEKNREPESWRVWVPLIMLFMAFCISRSIRCFSRLGMRPNRTAVRHNSRVSLFINILMSLLHFVLHFYVVMSHNMFTIFGF